MKKKTRSNPYKNHLFRASSLWNLMVNPRKKSEDLSETTKKFLVQELIRAKYGRVKEISSKFLEKGVYAEEDSISLLSSVLGKLFVKNKNELRNKMISGTPDIIYHNVVIDIKTAWDLFTFHNVNGVIPAYYWQLQGYMWLTGKRKAILAYTLVDAPEWLISQEQMRLSYKMKGMNSDEVDEFMAEIESNMKYGDIPEYERLKLFYIEYDKQGLDLLRQRIKLARKFMWQLDKQIENNKNELYKMLKLIK